jgi:hypothetical protein
MSKWAKFVSDDNSLNNSATQKTSFTKCWVEKEGWLKESTILISLLIDSELCELCHTFNVLIWMVFSHGCWLLSGLIVPDKRKRTSMFCTVAMHSKFAEWDIQPFFAWISTHWDWRPNLIYSFCSQGHFEHSHSSSTKANVSIISWLHWKQSTFQHFLLRSITTMCVLWVE